MGRLMKAGKLKSRNSCWCKEVENWSSIGSDLNSWGCRGKMVICQPFDPSMWEGLWRLKNSRCLCWREDVGKWGLTESDLGFWRCTGRIIICQPFDASMWEGLWRLENWSQGVLMDVKKLKIGVWFGLIWTPNDVGVKWKFTSLFDALMCESLWSLANSK